MGALESVDEWYGLEIDEEVSEFLSELSGSAPESPLEVTGGVVRKVSHVQVVVRVEQTVEAAE